MIIFAMTILRYGMKISKDSSVVVLATYQMVIQIFESPEALKLRSSRLFLPKFGEIGSVYPGLWL
jgi:hypothetical protein